MRGALHECVCRENELTSLALEHSALCEAQHLSTVRAEVDQRSTLPDRESNPTPMNFAQLSPTMGADRAEIITINECPRRFHHLTHTASFPPSIVRQREGRYLEHQDSLQGETHEASSLVEIVR